MAKCIFFVKNHVQGVGCRLFIIERLLETNLGGAFNSSDGRVKVLLEGSKKIFLDLLIV